MATVSAPPMASQLKSPLLRSRGTLSGTLTPRGISGTPLKDFSSRRRTCLTVQAIQAEKSTYQVIQPINNDPFIGTWRPRSHPAQSSLGTSNLPAYRTVVSPLLHGIEVGLAHGFFLVGPFVKTGPLRNTEFAGAAGSIAAGGLVVILTVCLSMYDIATFNEGEPSTAPAITLTSRKKVADKLQTAEGWAQYSGGFFGRISIEATVGCRSPGGSRWALTARLGGLAKFGPGNYLCGVLVSRGVFGERVPRGGGH
ncbi:hypothetical protein KSP40_PGU017525 [Platanthera guangdongensis]|uniref:PSI subunit V n=1 Tax=Platanthera guangdongensis TaxID=2320717 RepID=A0ABR2M4I9_9ASPA